ncbi:hypothetical protein GR170_15940, partial [Pseudooceanicola sp. GBMRC 2024]
MAEVELGAGGDLPQSLAPRAIMSEAVRDDDRPLYCCAGGGLIGITLAWKAAPRSAERLMLIRTGGPVTVPPGCKGSSPNIDIPAVQIIFNDSDPPLWQVPRDACRQMLVGAAELQAVARPAGAFLSDSIERRLPKPEVCGITLGETCIPGDSALVRPSERQSSFDPSPPSVAFVTRPAPRISGAGGKAPGLVGRGIFCPGIDQRLTFADFFVRLQLQGRVEAGAPRPFHLSKNMSGESPKETGAEPPAAARGGLPPRAAPLPPRYFRADGRAVRPLPRSRG